MCKRVDFWVFAFIGFLLGAQTVDAAIIGKVTNQAGSPIAGAILMLVKQQIKDTTGPDGSYALSTTNVTVFPRLAPATTSVILHGDCLDFSLRDPSTVTIEIFDVNGALLKKETQRDVQAGFYRFTIADNSRAAKLLLIRASIGADAVMLRFAPLRDGAKKTPASAVNSAPVGGSLAKITAINDTLKVSAANYTSKATAITSYDQKLDIVLDTASAGGAVTVNLDQTRQTIEGFGINDTWAKEAFSSTVADALFTTNGTGIGLSILRVGMNSSGAFASSNISSDISAAKSRGAKIIGSTWSPPGSWKSGQNGGAGSENGGGHLKPEYYEQWATRIADFAKNNKLYAMSPQNEPDFASCGSNEPCSGDYSTTLFTAEEMVAFIKVVGPKLQAAGVKVIAPEASEWIHTWSDTSACCSEPGNKPSTDPLKCGFPPTKCAPGKGYGYGLYLYRDKAAWAALDILGVHEYDTQRAEAWPAEVLEKDRKPVWQTEMCGTKWWPEQGPTSDINNGVVVAGWIHDAFVKGEAATWLWWWYKSSSRGCCTRTAPIQNATGRSAITANSSGRATRG
jgi:O-glycosyl hydrolase